MIVHKFGGTSLGDAARFRRAANLVAACSEPPVVVVSAVAGVTNRLEKIVHLPSGATEERLRELKEVREMHHALAREIAGRHDPEVEAGIDALLSRVEQVLEDAAGEAGREQGERPPPRLVDAVCAAGEDLSSALMVIALRAVGLRARSLDAREIVRTDAHFGRAVPADEETYRLARERLTPLVEAGEVPVLQGFVGATADGVTTTLGRGGSDFTAAIIGAALGASEVSIWTDVAGIFTADPRQVPGARILRVLGYEEAVELSYFGARVIHPAAAKHAVAQDVSLRVRSSFEPEDPGTLIRHDLREIPMVAAVASKLGVTLLKVRSRPLFMAHGFLALVFDILARHRLPVDLVATSHSSTAFTIDEDEELAAVIDELLAFAEVEVVRDLATVSVVGRGLMGEPGMSGNILSVLEQIPVHLISQASDVSLNFLVAGADSVDAVRRIHRKLIVAEDIPEGGRDT